MDGKDPHCPHSSHPTECAINPPILNTARIPITVDILVVLKMKPEGIDKVRPVAEKLIE